MPHTYSTATHSVDTTRMTPCNRTNQLASRTALRKLIWLALLLAGCSGNAQPSPPSQGQWYDYGGNEPTISGNSFAFPTDSNGVAGYFYTKLPASVGQTLTLNYSITGNDPVWAQHVQSRGPSDINPASLTLFLWRQGDDLSCNGAYASYRMWYPKRVLLKLGDSQVLSGPLDPNVWTGCFGKPDPTGFTASLANQLGLGFTFGGANFYGHGVWLSSGTAIFKINSFTVQ